MKKTAIAFLAFIVWCVANLSCGLFWGGTQFDVTASRRYTLDKASQDIVKNISEPVTLRLYISNNLETYSRASYVYAKYVTNMLKQYQKISPQQIRLEIIRVKPYSPEAKIADDAGIKPIAVNDEYAYFGLQAVSGNKQRVMNELKPGREVYFENDINRILIDLQRTEKPIVGIVSTEIPLFDNVERKKTWSAINELRADYQLANVTDNVAYVPTDIKVLIVLNPNDLSSSFAYALDQYLMYGGKMIVFVDPYSEVAHFYKGFPPKGKTNMQKLLREWGIEYNYDEVVGSFAKGLNIEGAGRYPLWFFVSGNGYEQLHFRTPGALEIVPHDGVTYDVLASSPEDGGKISADFLRYTSKKNIAEHFKSEEKPYNLIVQAKGKFSSAYLHGYYDNTEYAEEMPPFMFEAQEGATLVVVADSDFISDDAWVMSSDEENPIYGAEPYADNAEFLLSLINELLDGAKVSTAKLKHKDKKTIADSIAQPLSVLFEEQQSRLKTQYNLLQEQLK